ncbi:MAG: DnaJ domain-containing protein [Betaproteobacteria bacterium]
MKPTLYEALGLSPSAGDPEIKSALRRLVRRYYGKTRAGHADVEEALRFLNHASHILGDPARRSQYDADLAEGTRTESTLTAIGEPSAAAMRLMSSSLSSAGMSITDLGLPREKTPPVPVEPPPQWSAQLAEIRRTRAGQLSALLIVSWVFLLVWNLAVPSGGGWAVTKAAAIGIALTGILAVAAYSIVDVLSHSIWRLAAPEGPVTVVEGMIPRWRRDRTVFVGTGTPLEDATWLFRLRMAELKRVSAERVSDPRPPMRLLARAFDYALWSIVVFGCLGLLRLPGASASMVVDVLAHPLVAPIWITATWIPVEALFLAGAQTTPGRWLMCVYLHYQVSNPYSPEDVRFTFGGAVRRAYDVWWQGCAGWLPVLALIAMARAKQQLTRSGETSWDSRRDCLVTHGPVGTLSMVTVGLGLAAGALTFAAQWKDPVQAMAGWQLGWPGPTANEESTTAQPAELLKPGAQSRVSRIDDVAVVREAPAESEAKQLAPVAAPTPEPEPTPAPEPVPVPKVPAPTPASESAPVPKAPAPIQAPEPAPVPKAPAPIQSPEPAAVSTAPAPAPAAERVAVPKAPPPAPAAERVAVPKARVPAPTSPAPASLPLALAKAAQVEPPKSVAARGTAASADARDERPSSMELLKRRIVQYSRQAQRQQADGDYAALARTCQRWADEEWRNPRAFYCAGIGLQGVGQHRRAIDMFNRAGSLVPKDDPLKALVADAVLKSFRSEAQP